LEKETFPDAAVVALSKKFIWVKINRDLTPDLPKRFSVSAYPWLILLGNNEEKVHRFSGFKKPKDFLELLEDGLRRFDLYKQGKEWDQPVGRPESLCSSATIETFPAPSQKIPNGLTFLGGFLWIAQQGELAKVDRKTGKAVQRFDLPQRVRDLCTDGRFLYGMEYSWTAGGPIHVIDPATGKVVREIVTEKNKQNRSMGAMGIAWKGDKLYVLAGMRGTLHEIDPKTGKELRVLKTGATWLSGLCFDSKHFVAGSRKKLHWLDAETGKVVKSVPIHYPLRAIAAKNSALYAMEQPIFGHDKQHKRVQLWPKKMLVHKLTWK